MDSTERLALPLLAPGQAQKELFHNEALQRLDIAVAASVEGPPADDPPTAPELGTAYIVGDSPTGAWSGFAGHLAGFGIAGWRFIPPNIGMSVFEKSSQSVAIYSDAGWELGKVRATSLIIDGVQVVGPRMGSIADPSGGVSIDAEARVALGGILAVLRQHGLISP
jgi:hypothetical protein